ncbi:MAG: universal stress protein [Actinomycetota bacterium]
MVSHEFPGPIVVGVDGSDESVAALRWATHHAACVGSRVRAVTAFGAPPPRGASALGYMEEFEVAEAIAATHAGEAIARSGVDQPIERVVAAGPADEVIARHATDAAMIVLGTRDTARWQARLRGSLTSRLSGGAPCPVVSVSREHTLITDITEDAASV